MPDASAPLHRPEIVTFDVFGTLLDWKTGLTEAVRAATGRTIDTATFEAVIDHQARDEQEGFRPYAEITERSLVDVLGMPAGDARAIGDTVGNWPPFPDVPRFLPRLLELVPCGAITNSDPAHRAQVERGLGIRLTHWTSAGEVGAYKPDRRMWDAAAAATGVRFGPRWWHVSAYTDYDFVTARALGLTNVLVVRPHARYDLPDTVDLVVSQLEELLFAVQSTGLHPSRD